MAPPFPPSTSGPTGPLPLLVGGRGKAQLPSRNYFYLREEIDSIIRYIELGALFTIPLILAFFSKKWALAVVWGEIAAYYLGVLICGFDNWYNQRITSTQLGFPEPNPVTASTELEIALTRLEYFQNKYAITIQDIYRYLENDIVPFQDNLDWLELVSLINQLSLHIGERFKTK